MISKQSKKFEIQSSQNKVCNISDSSSLSDLCPRTRCRLHCFRRCYRCPAEPAQSVTLDRRRRPGRWWLDESTGNETWKTNHRIYVMQQCQESNKLQDRQKKLIAERRRKLTLTRPARLPATPQIRLWFVGNAADDQIFFGRPSITRNRSKSKSLRLEALVVVILHCTGRLHNSSAGHLRHPILEISQLLRAIGDISTLTGRVITFHVSKSAS